MTSRSRGLDFDGVRGIALKLPGVVEGTSYGTPAFRLGRKFLARLHEDGLSLVVPVGFDERDMLVEAEPETFVVTDHYRAYPMMLVRIAKVDPATLGRLLEQHWRAVAPKRVVAAFDAARA